MSFISKVRNFITPSAFGQQGTTDKKNPSRYTVPVQLQRLKQDMSTWRKALEEAEQAYQPHRVRMQQVFMDTVLNGHVIACMNRRKNLTLLKDFMICDESGKENEKATALFKDKVWFSSLLNYILDAQYFGYSLIALRDLENNEFPKIEIVKRHHVSPDRHLLTAFAYSISGENILEGEFADFCVWVPTSSQLGISKCGYGLLYPVAFYEIYLRILTGNNADFVDMFAQPYRVGKTSKLEGPEYESLVGALRDMGSAGYAIIDPLDEIEFLESKGNGKGYESYGNFEKRLESKISKIILGHADALDSTPGKLGSQGQDDDSVGKALKEIESLDNTFTENVINTTLIPKMRNMGFSIPDGLCFKFKNDKEKEAQRQSEDASNKVTADMVKTLKDAGYKVDPKYITERTGIPLTEVKEPEPAVPNQFNQKVKNKLDYLYGVQ